jgi:hypothetical protein
MMLRFEMEGKVWRGKRVWGWVFDFGVGVGERCWISGKQGWWFVDDYGLLCDDW